MKKRGITALAVSAVLILSGASVWEGAAAVASNGELPEGGYYAASNSFPRNTVVDVTNLETGKNVRVIIASGLDSPGLLAMLSRDAAGAIGLQNRSIGRVRMTQPSDPVAFSRFTEGRDSSGDPDFDPRAAVGTNILPADLFSTPETIADSAGTEAESVPPAVIPQDFGPEPDIFAGTEPESGAFSETAGPPPEADIFDPPAAPPGNAVAESGLLPVYPAWPGEDTYPEESSPEPVYPGSYEYLPEERIVDIPEAYEPPVIASRDDSIIPEPAPIWIDSGESSDVPDLSVLPDSFGPDYSEPVPGLTEPEDLMPETSLPGEALAESRDEPLLMPWENYDLTLVPAEERPPRILPDTLPPEAEIAPIPDGAPPLEPYMALDSFIDPIGGKGPSVTREPPVSAPPSIFSVPVISRLEQGKYYLQLAAFSRAEAVEQELSRIDRAYPLAVLADGSPERPLYRVLVGPVNLGESGALLLRFKGNGWGDAFIRNGS